MPMTDNLAYEEFCEEISQDILYHHGVSHGKCWENQELFKKVYHYGASGIALVNPDLRFLDINQQFCSMVGYTREELRTMTFLDITYPEDRKVCRIADQKLLNGDIARFRMEKRYVHKNGTILWASTTVCCIKTPDGQLLYTIALIEDVTKHKQAVDALRKNEKEYRTIMENIPALFCRILPDKKISYVNQNFCTYADTSSAELVGKNITDFFPDSHQEKINMTLHTLTEQSPMCTYEHCIKKSDTTTQWFEWIIIALFNDDTGLSEYQLIGYDVTKQKNTEKERQELLEQLHRAKKMEALGLLAGGVAHDLNNILSSIVIYPDVLLLEENLSDEVKSHIAMIKDSGQRAAGVVSDLLTIARGEVVERRLLDVNDVIGELLQSASFRKIKQLYPAVVIQQYIDNSMKHIYASRNHLEKVFMNLLVNALEALGDEGTISITTKNILLQEPHCGYEQIEAGEYSVVEIADSGPGIGPKVLERIFEPFFTRKKIGRSGTGLGLSIVWNIVHDHHGYVDVTSSVSGTTFSLYFPTKPLPEKNHTQNPDREEIVSSCSTLYKGKGETILVIDDEKDQRTILTTILIKLGFTVETVSSGEEAIEYLKKHHVDLVILDMLMEPGMNGREVWEQMVKICPCQKILITSGFSRTEEVKHMQSQGAGAFIQKPFTLEHISKTLQEALTK